IINEIPFVLKTGFYGTIALLIGLSLYVLNLYDLISFYTMTMVFFAGIVLRMIAYYKKWAIPMPS
ncbi:MAG: trimeric intracellular cation channel family protein, partial [Sulfurovum sp.]